MKFNIKDPGSALTHFIAMILAGIAAVPLLLKALRSSGRFCMAALAVFIVSMILLYAASTIYHTFDISEHVNRILRKIDHMMIFILIAGTYTPVCLIVLGNPVGYRLLATVWTIAVAGIIYALKLPLFNSRHKYFGSHEIFHLFVMGGSFCHYVMMFRYVAA